MAPVLVSRATGAWQRLGALGARQILTPSFRQDRGYLWFLDT